jgi:hypothetical protein
MADSTKLNNSNTNSFVDVVVARFDSLWPQINGKRASIHGVKIDVQGMELEVLRGMACTLEAWKPTVAVEFHRGVDRQQIISLLALLGYAAEPTPIDPDHTWTAQQLRDDHSYAFVPVIVGRAG